MIIKKKLRKKVGHNQSYLRGTGGGPYKYKPLEDYEEKMFQVIKLSAEGLSSVVDGDALTV